MRKLTSILFFFILLTPAFVSLFWLHVQQSLLRHEIKEEILAGMNKDELVLFKFTELESRTKLYWEHSREFEYNGEMFDVVESKVVGDTIYYWCWWDHEETKLKNQLADLLNKTLNSNPQNKEKQERINNFFKSLFCNKYSPAVFSSLSFRGNSFMYFATGSRVTFPPPTPPPRLV